MVELEFGDVATLIYIRMLSLFPQTSILQFNSDLFSVLRLNNSAYKEIYHCLVSPIVRRPGTGGNLNYEEK